MAQVLLVATRTADATVAQRLAAAVVEQRAAAASHLEGPHRSTYWWQGRLEQADEWVVEAVADDGSIERVRALFEQLHDYALPSIVTTRVAVSAKYADWVHAQTTHPVP